jgi:outer membrane scaffolding protein for murein synthesis (MipA/OmpV family)
MNRWMIAAAASAAFASPALAQSDAALPDPNDQSDTFTIGAGVATIPDYEGSDDHKLIPAAAIRGRVNGISFSTRGTWLYVDLIRPGSGIDFDAGPIIGARLNRTGKVKDDLVDALPERKTAFELGGFAGVTLHGLTNPYDALSFRVDVVKDMGSAHESTVITPTIEFGTPLSRRFYLDASLSGEWAGGGYADYYYSISPADALASGLPVYDADGGFKNWKLSLLANHSITGDLTHGFSLFGMASYGKLGGDFADSPIVEDRGSRSQTMAAIGLAYTF